MNEKQFTIIWVVLLVIILLAGGGAIWYLQFEILVEQKALLKQAQDAVADAQAKDREIPKLEAEIAKLKEQEAELITHIPNLTRAEYDDFADLLDALRRQSGVTVSRATWAVPSTPAAVPGGKPVKPIPGTVHKVQYDVTVSGTFYQLLRYVNLLEQHKRFIGVESFIVSKSGGDAMGAGQKISLKRDMKLTIYSYTYKPLPTPFTIEAPEERTGRSTEIPD